MVGLIKKLLKNCRIYAKFYYEFVLITKVNKDRHECFYQLVMSACWVYKIKARIYYHFICSSSFLCCFFKCLC